MGKSTQYLEAKDRDGYDIKLIPDKINLFGIGFDVFESNRPDFHTYLEMFREVQEVKETWFKVRKLSGGSKICTVDEYRRFKLKLHKDWFLKGEDSEREFGASYFMDSELNWVFRLDAYEEYYKGTPAENWIDW